MKALRWLGRKLRGPGWFMRNLIVAGWTHNLRDMASKPNQRPVKRVFYRLVVTVEVLLVAVLAALVMEGLAQMVIFAVTCHYLFTEFNLTWRRRHL